MISVCQDLYTSMILKKQRLYHLLSKKKKSRLKLIWRDQKVCALLNRLEKETLKLSWSQSENWPVMWWLDIIELQSWYWWKKSMGLKLMFGVLVASLLNYFQKSMAIVIRLLGRLIVNQECFSRVIHVILSLLRKKSII